jgi:hypothetical protein
MAAGSRIVVCLLLTGSLTAAQAPRLKDVVERVDAYLSRYGEQLAAVIAEETYRQEVPATIGRKVRTLRSDYALVRTGSGVWIGYRDTFDVDGAPVRDREERLLTLIRTGAFEQAGRIADQNARFNLANDLLPRTVNVPTLGLDLMHPRHRFRFAVRRTGTGVEGERGGWVLEFREHERPTIVRTPAGRDQPSRIEALVDPQTGEVLRTIVSWERVKGTIAVTFGRVPGIPVLVPLTMAERFTTPNEQLIRGDATYADYRQFQTSGRVIR